MPKIDSTTQSSKQSTVTYDLSKKVDVKLIENYDGIEYFGFENLLDTKPFERIIENVKRIAESNKENVLRVCINTIGSALWYSENFANEISKFLVQMKAITRYRENIVCLITIPQHLIDVIDDTLIFRLRKLADICINLQSFDGLDKQTHAVFKQYNGLLHIKKIHSLGAFQSHKPETFDLAFKLKSHRFVVEKFHLPPELGDDSKATPSMSCSSSGGKGNNNLDF